MARDSLPDRKYPLERLESQESRAMAKVRRYGEQGVRGAARKHKARGVSAGNLDRGIISAGGAGDGQVVASVARFAGF